MTTTCTFCKSMGDAPKCRKDGRITKPAFDTSNCWSTHSSWCIYSVLSWSIPHFIAGMWHIFFHQKLFYKWFTAIVLFFLTKTSWKVEAVRRPCRCLCQSSDSLWSCVFLSMFSQSSCERDRDRKISIVLFETEVLLMLRYSSEYNSVKGDRRLWHVASGCLLTESEVEDKYFIR